MFDFNSAVNKHRERILAAERYIWQNPETGFKEKKTDAYMKKTFAELGYELTEADGITGFVTVIDTQIPGPEVLILAELDSIICPAHPECDKETGAVHSCGHNAQCAALCGVAAALKEEGALDGLCGRIRLCAVPAEELLEIEYRSGLIEKGIIKYVGGKSEFLSRGLFDGVDLAFMVHTSRSFHTTRGSVGCIAKKITYKGRAAHAGGSPWAGNNALYAASCGLNAVNAIRETFRESDIIRVHPIITNGGAMVNAIPETATLESYVRGKTFEAIEAANKRVNRALIGGALSLGTNVDISDIPGYAPLINDKNLIALTLEAAAKSIPEYPMTERQSIDSGSTDMGDLSCIMPVIHIYGGGASGTAHGNDYYITDPEAACCASARLQLSLLSLLLQNGAENARRIIEEDEPRFASAEEYLCYVDSLNRSGSRISYGDGEARIILD